VSQKNGSTLKWYSSKL